MSIKSKDKAFYACAIHDKEINKVRKKEQALKIGEMNPLGIPDMFHILLHNQTIINEKLNQLLKSQS